MFAHLRNLVYTLWLSAEHQNCRYGQCIDHYFGLCWMAGSFYLDVPLAGHELVPTNACLFE